MAPSDSTRTETEQSAAQPAVGAPSAAELRAAAQTDLGERRADARPAPLQTARGMEARDVLAWYGASQALKGISLPFAPNQVTALIGPSGCGKSTFVRCLNRMHEEIPGGRVEGQITLDGHDIYASDADPVTVRSKIGMVFQKPNPFPTKSIFDNVAAGLKLSGGKRVKRSDLRDRVESSLRGAGLWEEVKDRLSAPGMSLSGGQQQRLCIARAIAVEPEVVLMDEPCSALDPVATLRIEELIHELRQRYTIVIVTHNMQQAARVADSTAFMLSGELVEFAPTNKIFTDPDDERTEQYVTGKFG